MTTLADTVAETRRRFFTSYRPQVNLLSANVGTSDTDVSVQDAVGSIQSGSNICVGLEVMRVRKVTGQQATVLRGWDGSTAVAHSANDLVFVNPQVSDFDIAREIVNDLADLSTPDNGLFKVTSTEFTYNPVRMGYDIPVPNIIDVLEVRYKDTGPANTWPTLVKWRYDESQNLTDFPSGNSLVLYEAGYPGQIVHVTVSVPFTNPVALTDDMQTTVGLPATCNDLPALGACVRLAAGREIQRNFNEAQGQPRRSDEVPAGANLGAYRDIAQLRAQRIIAEANRLKASYPMMRRY